MSGLRDVFIAWPAAADAFVRLFSNNLFGSGHLIANSTLSRGRTYAPAFQAIRMDVLSLLATLAARVLLVALFLPFSALDKVLNFEEAVDQAADAIHNRSFSTVMIFAGLAVEIVMSLAILTGFADRLAALMLAVYCVVTALLWKQFWKASDFRLSGASHGRATFWDFLKNLALAGGFLVLAFGATSTGFHTFLAHPLASSHPYAQGRKAGT